MQVREAANRTQCICKLKQLALAVANYTDTYNKYPKAAEENPELPPEQRLSWIVAIIPFYEANNLYNKMDHKKGWADEENRFAALLEMRILHCPSYLEGLPVSTLVSSHYVGISGLGENAIAFPRDDPRAGFFGYDRLVKIKDLKRGTSETVLIVETSQVHGAWTAAGSPTTRGLIPDSSPYGGVGGQFGGYHRGYTNVAFPDGSVRIIEGSVDPAVWEAMATLSGKGN
jgi:prepilin-type processing-associated H-X9-DG protein